MVTIARDINCPKCDYPETYQELSDDGSIGCRKCGWRVRLDVLDSLPPAQYAAYWEAVREGFVQVSARGRLAYETPGRRQYALPTLQRLRHLGLIEQRRHGAYGAWYLVDTAPVAEKVAVELSREDWADVHSAVDAALSIRWHSDPEKRARVLAAIAPAAATKEV